MTHGPILFFSPFFFLFLFFFSFLYIFPSPELANWQVQKLSLSSSFFLEDLSLSLASIVTAPSRSLPSHHFLATCTVAPAHGAQKSSTSPRPAHQSSTCCHLRRKADAPLPFFAISLSYIHFRWSTRAFLESSFQKLSRGTH